MTQEEYQKELWELNQEFDAKRRALARRYVDGLDTFKPGDIVADSTHTILVTEVVVQDPGPLGWAWAAPQWYYLGTQLTRELKPRKDGAVTAVSPENARKIK